MIECFSIQAFSIYAFVIESIECSKVKSGMCMRPLVLARAFLGVDGQGLLDDVFGLGVCLMQ